MIAALEAAICETLGAVSGVATARPYAGELADSQAATLVVPAALVALTRLAMLPDPGTGETLARAEWSAFCCTRNAAGATVRGADAWALVEAVLAAVRAANGWGVAGCMPAELVQVTPLWQLESRALAVREVRWTQVLRLGESEWTGEVAPEEIWLGFAPRVGAAYVDDYVLIHEAPAPVDEDDEEDPTP